MASKNASTMEAHCSCYRSGSATTVEPSTCWVCLHLPIEFSHTGPGHLKTPFPHLHLTCYSASAPLLSILSPCCLSARTRITKPPQDQSVIKGTQASMVCGVTHDPRVTVRYSLCCGPMEAKGEGSFRDSWASVDTKEVSVAVGP